MIEAVVKTNLQLLLDQKIAIRFSIDDPEEDREEFFELLKKIDGNVCTVYELEKYEDTGFFTDNFPGFWNYMVIVKDEDCKNGKGLDWCNEYFFEGRKWYNVTFLSIGEFLGNKFQIDDTETSKMFDAVFA